MTGLLLRLAGPLQSWGERSAFSAVRDTAPFPTRSGLTGILAAAEGLPRGASLQRYAELEFTVRIDRPGVLLTDFHTVGGGFPPRRTAATSGGKNKGDAVITRRHYLADAVFVVAVTGPDQRIDEIAAALHQPHWAPYLGRRSCVPDEPFVLRPSVADPVAELLHHVPLSRPHTDERRGWTRPQETDTVPIEFLWERPRPTGQDAVLLTSQDHPVTFAPHQRAHSKRHLYKTVEHLPAALLHHGNHTVHERLIDYATHPAADAAPRERTA
ncbi:type I-E CRISPR-associated protein Cas5/CasD [Streptomyces sp. NPDC086023]|uniref:type I-E CRISPR-associated protein Cas5/CasD n=1 Tax=Streptomyces sp. NPDC086023 TaxID=3365746 RepID=UPI0037D39F1B